MTQTPSASEQPDEIDDTNGIDEVDEVAASGDLEAAQAEIARLSDESAQRLINWQRAQADFENLKRRSAQDVRDGVDRQLGGIFRDLVDLADDFERALSDEHGAVDAESLRGGLSLMQQKLGGLLDRHGVHPIAAGGSEFDAAFHEVVATQPGVASEILHEIRRGYLIGGYAGKVLRHSQVIVGDGSVQPDPPAEPAEPTDPAELSESSEPTESE